MYSRARLALVVTPVRSETDYDGGYECFPFLLVVIRFLPYEFSLACFLVFRYAFELNVHGRFCHGHLAQAYPWLSESSCLVLEGQKGLLVF